MVTSLHTGLAARRSLARCHGPPNRRAAIARFSFSHLRVKLGAFSHCQSPEHMSVELAGGRKGRVMVRGCAMTARGRASGRRPPERLQGRLRAAGGRGSGTERRRVVFRGRGSELADLAFSKRDESTKVAKTGAARPSARGAEEERHAWTERDHACPDGQITTTHTHT